MHRLIERTACGRTGRVPRTAVMDVYAAGQPEIDLNAKNAASLRKLLAPYIEHPLKAGRAQGRQDGRAAVSQPAVLG